jgi:hypothetical protein
VVSNDSEPDEKKNLMLFTIAVILLILWALGLLTGYTMGGLVHILIVIALVAVVFRLISGRRVV